MFMNCCEVYEELHCVMNVVLFVIYCAGTSMPLAGLCFVVLHIHLYSKTCLQETPSDLAHSHRTCNEGTTVM